MTAATDEHENAALRQRSGSVTSPDPLVSFLYELMRDRVTPGVVEQLVRASQTSEQNPTHFCNGYLASYAVDVAARLRNAATQEAA